MDCKIKAYHIENVSIWQIAKKGYINFINITYIKQIASSKLLTIAKKRTTNTCFAFVGKVLHSRV